MFEDSKTLKLKLKMKLNDHPAFSNRFCPERVARARGGDFGAQLSPGYRKLCFFPTLLDPTRKQTMAARLNDSAKKQQNLDSLASKASPFVPSPPPAAPRRGYVRTPSSTSANSEDPSDSPVRTPRASGLLGTLRETGRMMARKLSPWRKRRLRPRRAPPSAAAAASPAAAAASTPSWSEESSSCSMLEDEIVPTDEQNDFSSRSQPASSPPNGGDDTPPRSCEIRKWSGKHREGALTSAAATRRCWFYRPGRSKCKFESSCKFQHDNNANCPPPRKNRGQGATRRRTTSKRARKYLAFLAARPTTRRSRLENKFVRLKQLHPDLDFQFPAAVRKRHVDTDLDTVLTKHLTTLGQAGMRSEEGGCAPPSRSTQPSPQRVRDALRAPRNRRCRHSHEVGDFDDEGVGTRDGEHTGCHCLTVERAVPRSTIIRTSQQ